MTLRQALTDAVYWSCCFVVWVIACFVGKNALLPLGAIGMALLLFPIYHSFRQGRFDPFTPPIISLIFTFQQLLRPLYWYSQGSPELIKYPATPERIMEACIRATIYLYIGQAVYYFAYYALPPIREVVRIFPRFGVGWSAKRTGGLIKGYLAAGALSYCLFMYAAGGLLFFLAHIYIRSEVSQGLGPVGVGIHLLVTAGLVLHCYQIAGGTTRKKVVLVGIPVLVAILSLGGRGYAIVPIIIALICSHYCVKRINVSKIAAIAVAIVLFSVIFVTIRAGTAQTGGVDASAFDQNEWSPSGVLNAYFKDQNQLDSFAIIVDDMPHQIDYQLGATWGKMITLPIPSKIWTHKPLLLEGRVIGETYFGDKVGIPPGFVGTLYMNFHIVGVVIGFFLLGVFHKALRGYLILNIHDVRCVCFYALTALFLFEITNLSLINWLDYAPFLLIAFWVSRGYSIVRLRGVRGLNNEYFLRIAGTGA